MKFSIILFAIAVLLVIGYDANAQCAMCKAITQSNADGGGSIVDGLNAGILYLMAIPYVMLAFLGILFYRKNFLGKMKARARFNH